MIERSQGGLQGQVMWIWRRIENINWIEHNDEVLAMIEAEGAPSTHPKKEATEMDRAHAYRRHADKNDYQSKNVGKENKRKT